MDFPPTAGIPAPLSCRPMILKQRPEVKTSPPISGWTQTALRLIPGKSNSPGILFSPHRFNNNRTTLCNPGYYVSLSAWPSRKLPVLMNPAPRAGLESIRMKQFVLREFLRWQPEPLPAHRLLCAVPRIEDRQPHFHYVILLAPHIFCIWRITVVDTLFSTSLFLN